MPRRLVARALLVPAMAISGCGPTADRAPARAAASAPEAMAIPAAGRVRGSANAPVTVYELSDFQCGYCRRFAQETYPLLDERYVRTGRVRWAFVNYPRTESHPNARRAAEFAACAALQGRFRQMHDLLFSRQDRWSGAGSPDPLLAALADTAGAPRSAKVCASATQVDDVVRSDQTFGSGLGIGGVPAFVVDGRMVVQGAQPAERFVEVLDSILRTRDPGKAAPLGAAASGPARQPAVCTAASAEPPPGEGCGGVSVPAGARAVSLERMGQRP